MSEIFKALKVSRRVESNMTTWWSATISATSLRSESELTPIWDASAVWWILAFEWQRLDWKNLADLVDLMTSFSLESNFGVSLWNHFGINPEKVTFISFLTFLDLIWGAHCDRIHGKQSHWEDGQSLGRCMATQCSRARNGTSGMCFSLLCRAPTSAKSKFGVIQRGSMHFAACEQWVAHSARNKTGSLVRSIGYVRLIRWKFH